MIEQSNQEQYSTNNYTPKKSNSKNYSVDCYYRSNSDSEVEEFLQEIPEEVEQEKLRMCDLPQKYFSESEDESPDLEVPVSSAEEESSAFDDVSFDEELS